MQDQKEQEKFEQFAFGNEQDETENVMEGSPMGKTENKAKSTDLPKDKIKCVKCKGVFAQRPDVREKRVDKFGSVKMLEENYLCRECRRGKVWNGKDWEAKPEKKAKPKAKKK